MEERTIKIDKLIEDLKYDVDHGYEELRSHDLDEFRRVTLQFDVDCKNNFIWMLEDEYKKQQGLQCLI